MTNLKHLLASATLALLCGTVHAAPIAIYNTGVDASGTPQGEDAPELHYTLIDPSPTVGTPFVTTAAGGFPVAPFGPWIGDNGISSWITPAANTEGGLATFVYRTTFDLTGFDASSAVLTGRWASDNAGLEIYVNALGTGSFSGSFSSWSAFSVTSGFTEGINTLDFFVRNDGGPTGLRVEFLGATAERLAVSAAEAVPEPGSLMLVGVALAGLGVRRRKGA